MEKVKGRKAGLAGRTDQVNIRLAEDVRRLIRLEAADLNVYPNQIVDERLRESYRNRPLDIAI